MRMYAQRTPEQRAKNTAAKRTARAADPKGYNAYMRAYRAARGEKHREYLRDYYRRTAERQRETARRSREGDRERSRRISRESRRRHRDRNNAAERAWCAANPVAANAARKKREQQPQYKIINAVRDAVRRMAKRGAVKAGPSVKYLGAPLHVVRAHIEALWQPGMSWENYGLFGWHIDHIKPLDAFDVMNPEQLAAAAHYTNLQPLWFLDNLTKSNRHAS
jgi:hypothetical protein